MVKKTTTKKRKHRNSWGSETPKTAVPLTATRVWRQQWVNPHVKNVQLHTRPCLAFENLDILLFTCSDVKVISATAFCWYCQRASLKANTPHYLLHREETGRSSCLMSFVMYKSHVDNKLWFQYELIDGNFSGSFMFLLSVFCLFLVVFSLFVIIPSRFLAIFCVVMVFSCLFMDNSGVFCSLLSLFIVFLSLYFLF